MLNLFENYLNNRGNPLNAKLNSICPLLALVGAHHILQVSRVRDNLIISKFKL
jgi:hypothetical protein